MSAQESQQHRPWTELTKDDRERLGTALVSLKEFAAAFQHIALIQSEHEEGSALIRFLSNALYYYVNSYYLSGGAHGLAPLLRHLGCHDFLKPIEALFATKLGATTFRDIIGEFRNKFLAHPSFRFDLLEKAVHRKFDLHDPANGEILSQMIHALFSETAALFHKLDARYPEALQQSVEQ